MDISMYELREEIKAQIIDNLEISIYNHAGRLEVELYYDGMEVAADSEKIPGMPWVNHVEEG